MNQVTCEHSLNSSRSNSILPYCCFVTVAEVIDVIDSLLNILRRELMNKFCLCSAHL